MKTETARAAAIVVLTSLGAVTLVFLTATLSILLVDGLQRVFAFIIDILCTAAEVIIAFVAAITSGITVTLAVIVAAVGASVTFPARLIQMRILVAIAIAGTSIVMSAAAILIFTPTKVDWELGVALVGAAACAVAFASAWSVGVMSLIEKETQQVGLRMGSILDYVRHNQYYVLKVLLNLHAGLKQRDINISLTYSVKAGFLDCAELLLMHGADPNAKDAYENTSLHLASENGSRRLVELLIEQGARVDVRNGGHATPLHVAAKWGYESCVQLLVLKGAQVNVQDALWRTPLVLAARHAPNAESVMRMLIQSGADVNMVGCEQRTVFHYATSRGLDVAMLVEAGANPFMKDSDGNTPLHYAALEGHSGVVTQLLKLGCNPDVQNRQLRSPLHLASSRGDLQCIGELVSFGGDFNLPDSSGNLPIWHSINNHHLEGTVFFLQRNCRLGPFRYRGQLVQFSNPLILALDKRYLRIAKALVIGGCDTSPLSEWLIHVPVEVWDKQMVQTLNWLKAHHHNSEPLSHICRKVIRKVLRPNLLQSIDTLPLPRKIKEFVHLSELSECAHEVGDDARHDTQPLESPLDMI